MYKSSSPIDERKLPWCFIGAVKEQKESFENTMVRKVEKEMGIKIEKVEFVSKCCYHARLTDDNVNKIKRAEGQLLDFFTLKELKKLLLSNTTAEFVSKHSSLM